jgi:hypothetical protein
MERFLVFILPFLYPALKPWYNKYKRQVRYYAFKKAFISVQDKLDFWRSYEDQINIELRFTASDDCSLGYLDFLDTKRSKETFDRPPIPMTILVAGTGHFSKPFQINRHDPLIRSISIYVEDAVVSFFESSQFLALGHVFSEFELDAADSVGSEFRIPPQVEPRKGPQICLRVQSKALREERTQTQPLAP